MSKVVIIGNGGAGKTTVARRILEQSDAKIKFELNAESEKTLLNSFLELGECLSVTKDQKLELDIIRNVQDAEYQKRRLVRFVANLLKKSNNWFLLFDNAQSVNSIQKFLPINKSIWGCGKVLITTRNQNVVDNSLIKSDQIVDIGKLSEFEKRNLFSIIVYDCKFPELSSSDQSEISKFLQMIPDFPLDICAAAYYIKNTKISLDDYATLMKKNIKELSKEQKELLSENVNYNTTRYSIVCSMLKELTEKSKKFQYLLAIICLMDSQSIPKNILRKTIGSIEADHFIRKLKEHSFAVDSGNEISIHRSNHEIGLSFSLENMKSEELVDCVHLLVDELREEKQLKMVPHMESVLTKISKMKMQKDLAQDEAVLLIAISDIIRRQTHHMNDALVNLQKAIELSSQFGFFDNHVKAIAHLKMGEIYTIINQNNDAYYHLQSSLQYFAVASQNKVQNLRLLGIVQMRKHKFNEANQYFSEALKILQGINMNEIDKKLSTSNIYEDMAFNYFMNGINRKNARLAVPLMEKAVAILDDPNAKNIEEIVSRQAVHKMKLAGIHNALANYQKALDISNETEDLIEKSGIDNCDIFYVKGLIARERGLAYLRLNRIFKSYEYFKRKLWIR